MTVHPAVLKAGATLPHVVASALLCLVVGAALPAGIAAGWLVVGMVVSLVLATGRLEGPAVRILWRARPPTDAEARLLARPWQQAAARVDVAGLHLWVGGTGHAAFAAGPHHLVLSHAVVAGHRTGRLTADQVSDLLVGAVGRLRHGRLRFDLVVGFWTYPWDLLRGLAVGIGRRLAWIPLVAFAWRIRFIVGTIAVIQETLAGRPALAIIIAIFITLTYLTPASRRAWEQHLTGAAGAFATRHSNPTPTLPPSARWLGTAEQARTGPSPVTIHAMMSRRRPRPEGR